MSVEVDTLRADLAASTNYIARLERTIRTLRTEVTRLRERLTRIAGRIAPTVLLTFGVLT
jgi:hypothetical protein